MECIHLILGSVGSIVRVQPLAPPTGQDMDLYNLDAQVSRIT